MDGGKALGQTKALFVLVRRVIEPELPSNPILLVEIETVFSKAVQVIAWRAFINHAIIYVLKTL